MGEVVDIVVVEDHELLLDALVTALDDQSDINVVAAVRTVHEFGELIADLRVDVVVTDLDLGEGSGVEIAELAKMYSGGDVLFMTGRGDDRGVGAAIQTGSAGFVSKTAPLEEMVAAIRSVAAGAAVFPATLLRRALEPDLSHIGATISEREMTVLQELAQGRTASEIADTLVLSLHTVRNHIRSLLSKLQARSQLEAVVIAVRAGLIEIN